MSNVFLKTQFNSNSPCWMHIDLNSCFATIEQQANPLLRGKPIAVAAYTTPRGCILAPSVEAKKYGVKVGMRVVDGKKLCPQLIILPSDPPKYRFINKAFLQLFNNFTPDITVKSIDEMLLKFDPSVIVSLPAGRQGVYNAAISLHNASNLIHVAHDIKRRIKSEIGDWLTVSIGISTNPYLAKLAAGLHKPDGLDEINQYNILNVLASLKLTDLPYIKQRNASRLFINGIKNPMEFYFASDQQLRAAFQSINAHYWYRRLHGLAMDEVESTRKSIGHEYSLPKPTDNPKYLSQILYQLTEKMGRRLRHNHLTAQGIHLGMFFTNRSFWHQGHKFPQRMYATSDLFNAAKQLLKLANIKPVRILSIACFSLEENLYNQLNLFHDESKKRSVTQAVDEINDRWGDFSVTSASLLKIPYQILDRIAFGSVMDMPKFILKEKPKLTREEFLN